RVDAGDPQAAEIALALPPVPVRVRERLQHLLVGGPEGLALAPVVAAGKLENLLMAAALPRAALDARHQNPSSLDRSGAREQPLEAAGVGWIQVTRPPQAPLAVHRLLGQQVRAVAALVLPLAGRGLPEALPGA